MNTVVDILSGFSILFFAVLFYYIYGRKKYPPGPIPYPFLGNSCLIKRLRIENNGLPYAFQELCKVYKTNILSLNLGREYVVVVQTEELVNQVLYNEEFQGRPDNFFIRLRSMGKRIGITMTDGPHWEEQRMFALKNLHELGLGKQRMNSLIQGQLQDLLSSLEKSNIHSINLRNFLSKCVLNVLWEIVSGDNFKHNEQQLNDLITFMEERAKVFDMSFGLLTQFPFIRFICPKYCGYTLIQDLNKGFKNMIMAIINEHKQTYSKYITRDYIDAFLHEMYKKNKHPNNNCYDTSFTDDQLIMVCLDFFIAGSQTTSTTLDFLFFHMVRNPDIQEKVHEELISIFKPGDIPSCSDRRKCPYTEAVILEVHRLTPVTPIIGPRRVIRNTVLDGYFIPKETTILLNIQASYMNPEKWDNPKLFRPERFLTEEGRLLADKLFFFGKGKRRCPGEALAKNFIFIFFSGILLNYKLKAQDGNPPPMKIVPGLTQSPVEYSIKMIKRFT